MFLTTAQGSVGNEYINKDTLTATPGTILDADDRNIIQFELASAVESSGQTLDPTGIIQDQVARAASIMGGAASSSVDTGTVNQYIADPVIASMVTPGEYTLMDGFIVTFEALFTNTGASTLSYDGLSAKSITTRAGATLTGDEIQETVWLIYNLASDRWEFLFNSTSGLGPLSVDTAELALNAVTSTRLADGAVTVAKLNASVTEADNVLSRVAKAWVKFNGTGVVAINSSFNVSSITDLGVGHYAVNFIAPFSNNTYVAAGMANNVATTGGGVDPDPSTLSSGIFGIYTRAFTAPTTLADLSSIHVAFFGD